MIIDRRYRVLGLLGEGGAGRVHRVEDLFHPGRELALKRIRAGEVSETLAREEFLLLASLEHPALARVESFGIDAEGGDPYFTQELIEGPTLSKLARELDAQPPVELLRRIALSLSDVLAYLHERGVLHADVKPSNVLIEQSTAAIRLVDLGIARGPSTPRRSTPGTPGYVAPEVQAGAALSAGSDLYALGATIFAAAERRAPSGAPPRSAALAGADPELCEIVSSLLDPDPARRPSAHEVRARLFSAGGGAIAPPGASLVGRSAALAEAVGAAEEPGAVVVLEGETGIGKTRLLRAIRQTLEVNGVRACDAERGPVPPAEAIFVDDADERSAETLSEIAGEAAHDGRASSIATIAAVKERTATVAAFLSQLGGREVTIRLEALGPRDVEAMARSILGSSPRADFLAELVAATGGVPGRVRAEISRAHAEGRLALTPTGWRVR